MAVSDLLPRKAAGSKSRKQTLHDRLDYDQKEEKTNGGTLVTICVVLKQQPRNLKLEN